MAGFLFIAASLTGQDCRYVGASAMEQLGKAFVAAGEVMQHFQKVMTEELELGYLRGEKMQAAAVQQKAGLHRLEQGILQKRIAAPLGEF